MLHASASSMKFFAVYFMDGGFLVAHFPQCLNCRNAAISWCNSKIPASQGFYLLKRTNDFIGTDKFVIICSSLLQPVSVDT